MTSVRWNLLMRTEEAARTVYRPGCIEPAAAHTGHKTSAVPGDWTRPNGVSRY
jgi:hypothetical protein